MSGFVEGVDRSQSTFFPAMLDDYVAEDNLVRAVDAFVEGLELGKLGFGRVAPLEKGRPSYHPATLLKIYIYGYLNRVSSSRRLERECQRNIELVWLTGQLAPDFKTIADFRKDNGKAIREVCRRFVALCRELDLLSVASVAIDGSKFKAVNARDKNFTEAKMRRRLERIDESIARYMAQLETADRHGDAVPEAKVVRLKDKIAKLKEEIVRLNAINAEMMKSEDNLADRSGCAFDGNERQGHRNRRLQCASRSRYQEPYHCGPRGDEHRHRPPSTVEYGGAGPNRDGR
jgi:transposase